MTGSCTGNDLPPTGERPFRIGGAFVKRAAFGGDNRFHTSVGETSAADGSRDGIKQRIEFVV